MVDCELSRDGAPRPVLVKELTSMPKCGVPGAKPNSCCVCIMLARMDFCSSSSRLLESRTAASSCPMRLLGNA
eukprot:CAMPEP_0172786936 /NCGR_PEP_ID=MMETSP1074-20121228/206199_1 /TAXON_ID=2916 /ORGANISM="Ceratium fusus, Strain PA161109" /LENGTH=72 /DNA_ID=CAMNT_0013623955 /DNA_START=702 /DNA_END=920 /DNA_ORIENTATION=-